MTFTDIEENRRKFLNYLRENPEGFSKITCLPANDFHGRCLVGMACEAFGESLENYEADPEWIDKPYDIAQQKLNYDADLLWRLNDSVHEELSFSEMADRLEKEWDIHSPES